MSVASANEISAIDFSVAGEMVVIDPPRPSVHWPSM
jgi:hypothetical protein